MSKRTYEISKTEHFTRESHLHLGHDRRIHIVNQRRGESSLGQVTLTRGEFEQFVRFYEKAKQEMAAE